MFEQPDALPEIPRDVLIAIRDKRLDELERLRAIGMHKAERLDKAIRGKLTAADVKLLVGRRGGAKELEKTCRAVRQIMALEFEIMGLWVPPDRDAQPEPRTVYEAPFEDKPLKPFRDPAPLRDDIDDYNRAPLDVVAASIREALDAKPPETDPFAPVPRQPRLRQPTKIIMTQAAKRREAERKARKKAWRQELQGFWLKKMSPAKPGRAPRYGGNGPMRTGRGRGPPR